MFFHLSASYYKNPVAAVACCSGTHLFYRHDSIDCVHDTIEDKTFKEFIAIAEQSNNWLVALYFITRFVCFKYSSNIAFLETLTEFVSSYDV